MAIRIFNFINHNKFIIKFQNIETNAVSSLETRQIALLNELHELKQTVRRIAAKQLPTNVATAKPTTAPKRARELPICGKPAPLYIQQRILQIEKNGEGKPILVSHTTLGCIPTVLD